jgi:hypothetical protein
MPVGEVELQPLDSDVRIVVLLMVLFVRCCGQASADVDQHAGHALGTVVFPITCTDDTQREFNRDAVARL